VDSYHSIDFHQFPKNYEIDYVGTGTFQASELNLFQKRSIEPNKNVEAQLSARGLHHRSREAFIREVKNQTAMIRSVIRNEKRTTGKYKPSPQLFIHHFQRALAYERIREIDKAIDDYTFCIEADEAYAIAYFNRGGLYKIKKQYEKAMADINKAIQLQPANIEFRRNRSLWFRENNCYIDAVKDVLLSRAILRQPNIAKTLENGGDVRLDGDLLYSSKIPEDPIIFALNIPCLDRKEEDLEPILDFIKNVKLFSSFASNRTLLTKIASRIEIRYYEKGKFVFQEGDDGDCCYIILDGEVSIVKLKSNQIYLEEMFNIDEDDVDEILSRITDKTTLVRLFRGHHFGETALENASSGQGSGARTAGAITMQTTRLCRIDAQVYNEIMSKYKSLLTVEIRLALSSSSIFKDWDAHKLDELAKSANLRMFSANCEILKAGEPVKYLMMVKSGIVKLLKKIPKPDTKSILEDARTHTLSETEETPGLWILEKNSINIYSKAEEKIPIPSAYLKTSSSKLNEVEFTVGIIGSGQVFGELAVLDPGQPSRSSAISFTAVELYCFDSDVLLSLGIKFNYNKMNCLNEILALHDPPPEKLQYYFRSRFTWELRKIRLINKLTSK
jgi:CRP-like cAMP-binding protein